MATDEPMTSERLADVREIIEDSQEYWELDSADVGNLVEAANDLLAEIDSLRAEARNKEAEYRRVITDIDGALEQRALERANELIAQLPLAADNDRLRAEVARLTEMNMRAVEAYASQRNELAGVGADLEANHATIARLRPVVEAVARSRWEGLGGRLILSGRDDAAPLIEQARAALEGEAGQ